MTEFNEINSKTVISREIQGIVDDAGYPIFETTIPQLTIFKETFSQGKTVIEKSLWSKASKHIRKLEGEINEISDQIQNTKIA